MRIQNKFLYNYFLQIGILYYLHTLKYFRMAKEAVETDVRDRIKEHLDNDDRTLAWLSEKTGIKYPTLYSCFTQRLFRLSDENLKKINLVLETKFKNNKD